MSSAPLDLQAGDHVSTTFNHGRESIHAIVARKLDANCQSGVIYRVLPDLGGWIDAASFTQVSGFEERHDGLYNEERDASEGWAS